MGLGAAIRVNGVPDTDFDGAALVEVVERAGETTTYMLRLPVTRTSASRKSSPPSQSRPANSDSRNP